jgi:hypothetical protein
MRKNQVNRLVTIAGIGVIAAIVAFVAFLQVEAARNNEFKRSIDQIAFDTIALTHEYQAEEGKWNSKQYDNSTMIAIIDNYQPRYQELIDRANTLDTPERYKAAKDYLIKSVEAEKQSNERFRDYLVTGDHGEYERSVNLFSQALQYSASYDAAIKEAG